MSDYSLTGIDIDLHRDAASSAGRVALWQDTLRLSGTVEVENAETFWARFTSRSFGPVATMSVAAATFRLTRDRSMCNRVLKDHVILNWVEKGVIRGSLAGRQVYLDAGSVVISRLANVMDVVLIDAEWHALLLPRNLVEEQIGWMTSHDGQAFAAGSAEAALLRGLQQSVQAIPAPVTSRNAGTVVRSSLALLAACLDRPIQASAPLRSDINPSSIHRFIQDHLRDPELGADMICKELSISRSALYRAMGDQAAITATIRRLRLYGVRRDIVSTKFAHLSLAEIGRNWGLLNERSLRRAFAIEFGNSPSSARKQAQLAGKTAAPVPSEMTAELESRLLA